MTVDEIAKHVTELNRQGKFDEAGETYWADDVVSLEAMDGEMAVCRGKDAVRAKGDWFSNSFTIDALAVEGPYVRGDQFIVRFTMSTTNRESGEKASMDELGVYTVKDGKIVEERFFYLAA